MTNPIADILRERAAQDKKWGVQNHDFPKWMVILQEELGEMSKDFLDGNTKNFRTEMVQCAAVLVAMIESGDRNNWF